MNTLLPPGHTLYRRFLQGALPRTVTAPAAAELVSLLPWRQESVTIFGKTHPVPRLTHWMGTGAYTYSGIRHEPAPLPEWVSEIRHALVARFGQATNSVLANLYRGGQDTVGWHSDDEPELGRHPWIGSLSLGAARTFAVRTKLGDARQTWRVTLDHGDLLVMSGESQIHYQHTLPRTTRQVGPRVNLTFRIVNG